MSKHHKQRHQNDSEFKDPVCKMLVSPKSAIDELEYFGKKLYFCSSSCRLEFELDPDKYLPNDNKYTSK